MEKSSNNKPSILKNIFNKDFIISAIIPIIIFSVFDNMGMTLNGIVLSGVWSIGVVCINFIKEKEINVLATFSAVFSAIGVIASVVSKNPTLYLISPIIQDILFAFIFFGSVFLGKPLIQVVVEQSYLKNVSEEFKKRPKYKKLWIIITIAWGVLNVSQAALRIILLYTVSMTSYYSISTVYGNVSGPILLVFSIMFSHKYLRGGND